MKRMENESGGWKIIGWDHHDLNVRFLPNYGKFVSNDTNFLIV